MNGTILRKPVGKESKGDDNLTNLIQYVKDNDIRVLPVIGKIAQIKDWVNTASSDIEQIEQWAKEFVDCNWGMIVENGRLVIDIDKHDFDGEDTWIHLTGQDDLTGRKPTPETLETTTKNGGRHINYKYDHNFISIPTKTHTGENDPMCGVDVKTNGYVLISPSTGYISNNKPVADAPDWLIELVQKQDKSIPTKSDYTVKNLSIELDHATKCVSMINVETWDDRDIWISIGMSLSIFGDAGLQLWIEGSKQSEKFIDGECEDLWDGFDPAGDITLGTLHFYAEQDNPDEYKTLLLRIPEIKTSNADETTGSIEWLDEYVKFSKRWSPIAFDGYHEACALWVLSTIAARRVLLHRGPIPKYTNLYILLVGKTSLYAKSTTARIGQALVRQVGCEFLLTPYSSTPQKFIKNMSKEIPHDWNKIDEKEKDRQSKKLAFHGSRGMYHDEFGSLLRGVSQSNSTMTEWRHVLRTIDDASAEVSTDTIGRGYVKANNPYLALMGSITPADISPLLKRDTSLWNDGFFPRFAFVSPPADHDLANGDFPDGEMVFPNSLTKPLIKWHKELGKSICTITEQPDGDKSTLIVNLLPEDRQVQACEMSEEVKIASKAYFEDFRRIIAEGKFPDLDGCYSRFDDKATRIAMLFASLDNGGQIEMRHWNKAVEIVERWRVGVHELYTQLQEVNVSSSGSIRDRLFSRIDEIGRPTFRELSRIGGLRQVDRGLLQIELDRLVDDGIVRKTKEGRTSYYSLGGSKSTQDDEF